jgi:phosphoglycerate dehydrogenase-like enzyme
VTRRPRALLSMWPDVVPEAFPPAGRRRLESVVDLLAPTPLQSLDGPEARHLADIDVLVTSWGALPLDDEMWGRAPGLRGVFHAAGSVKAVIPAESWPDELVVTSATALGARPVVEYTLAMVALSAHRALPLAQAYRAGTYPPVRGRRGRHGLRVGIVGASSIGRGVIAALVSDGWTVTVYDPVVDPSVIRALGARPVELDDLCRESDIVSLHAPEIPATRGMIDARRLSLMPAGATLINTARGGLVDHDALAAACRTGRLDAVLDVTDPEPLPADHELLRLPNVLCTPHAAGVQGSEIAGLGEFIVDELDRYSRGEQLHGTVDRLLVPTLA